MDSVPSLETESRKNWFTTHDDLLVVVLGSRKNWLTMQDDLALLPSSTPISPVESFLAKEFASEELSPVLMRIPLAKVPISASSKRIRSSALNDGRLQLLSSRLKVVLNRLLAWVLTPPSEWCSIHPAPSIAGSLCGESGIPSACPYWLLVFAGVVVSAFVASETSPK